MNSFSAKSRIAFGLVGLMTSIVLVAMSLEFVPDQRVAVRKGRAALCEAIAFNGSVMIKRADLKGLHAALEATVNRNPELLSAAIRRSDGVMMVDIGDHASNWEALEDERSSETQVQVPIWAGQSKWGVVQLRFTALGAGGFWGFLLHPWTRFCVFVAAASFVLYYFYLGKMLQHLDPSKVVPSRVRSALDTLTEGLLVMDGDGQIVLANQAFAEIAGQSSERLVGYMASEFSWADEAGAAIEDLPWDEVMTSQMVLTNSMLYLKVAADDIRSFIVNCSPIIGGDGATRGVLVSFEDVTELEKNKLELRESRDAADAANQAKSEFLARMSHEIRTPMNAILGYTDVLRRGFDERVENRQEYLNTIHSSGEHLLALINDILDLSKVESGQMELEMERCSPHQLISQAVTLLRSKADEKGISFEFTCDGLLPETILTDSVRLRQTIMNLAGNAVKFTEEGGVMIVARLVGDTSGRTGGQNAEPANTQLAIDVIDTGAGIPDAAQDKIFEPFAQADTSVTRKFGGTGLGLAISRQLAESMGGGIQLSSIEGKGSRFTVTIDTGPLDGIKMVDGQAALTPVTAETSESKEVQQLPPARILVADDGESNRKLIELVLGRAGVEVVSVENGELAVWEALENPFDAILMDMQMPVMDGYSATHALRVAGYEAPILALTAHAMRGDEEKCRAAGCDGFLTKPIKIDHLLATLSEVLAANGLHVAPETHAAEDPLPPAPATDELATECGAEDECRHIEESLAELTEMSHTVSLPDSSKRREPESSLAGAGMPTPGVTPAATPAATPTVDPLRCSYPLDDPDFLEIAEEFVGRLDEKLAEMRAACSKDDAVELACLAHWLKGSGGTAGFDAFTQPAYDLELAAKAQQRDRYESLIDRLAETAARIDLGDGPSQSLEGLTAASQTPAEVQPATDDKESPLLSSLPLDDADFREIVEAYVVRLGEQLEAMERAWRVHDYDELGALGHWLKGSGGTAGFDNFTTPAKALEQFASLQDEGLTRLAIDDLRCLARRIVIPTKV